MKLSKVIICVFRDGSRLIKNRHAVRSVFRQEAFINDHWEVTGHSRALFYTS